MPKDKSGSVVLSLISYGLKSKARLVIVPLQDYMQLSSQNRMNTPGTEKGNWEWRFQAEELTDELSQTIVRLSKGRN